MSGLNFDLLNKTADDSTLGKYSANSSTFLKVFKIQSKEIAIILDQAPIEAVNNHKTDDIMTSRTNYSADVSFARLNQIFTRILVQRFQHKNQRSD